MACLIWKMRDGAPAGECRRALPHSGGDCEKPGLPEHTGVGASGPLGSACMTTFCGRRSDGIPGTARLACWHLRVTDHDVEMANGGRCHFYRVLNRRPKNMRVPESGIDRRRDRARFLFAGMCRYGIPCSGTWDTADRVFDPACSTRRRNGIAAI